MKNIFKPTPKTRTQLIKVLQAAEKNNILDAGSLSMIEGILQISQMQARDIMLPYSQMSAIHEEQTLKEMLSIVIESGHSRFPVLNDERDEVIGILLAKDLLNYCFNDKDFDINDILRPAIFIPESKQLDSLLREFRKKRHHIAIVVDEYGSIVGLITIENILEQIVGNIEDEHDINEEANIKKLAENEYTLKAATSMEEFNGYFNTQFNNETFDTIGGLVVQQFGYIPKRDENITIKEFCFTILKADSRRVYLLRVTKK